MNRELIGSIIGGLAVATITTTATYLIPNSQGPLTATRNAINVGVILADLIDYQRDRIDDLKKRLKDNSTTKNLENRDLSADKNVTSQDSTLFSIADTSDASIPPDKIEDRIQEINDQINAITTLFRRGPVIQEYNVINSSQTESLPLSISVHSDKYTVVFDQLGNKVFGVNDNGTVDTEIRPLGYQSVLQLTEGQVDVDGTINTRGFVDFKSGANTIKEVNQFNSISSVFEPNSLYRFIRYNISYFTYIGIFVVFFLTSLVVYFLALRISPRLRFWASSPLELARAKLHIEELELQNTAKAKKILKEYKALRALNED